MDNKNKKDLKKFQFVSEKDIKNNKSNEKFKVVKEEELEKEVENKTSVVVDQTNNPKFTRHYFNFETRVAIMMVLVLLLFGCACFFSLEAINFGKNEIVSYDEVGKVGYKVCLKPNEFYNDQCIDEGLEYVSDIVDSIKADFYYDVDFSSNIDYKLYYHIAAVTRIYDANDPNKILYQNNETIIDKTNIKNNQREIKFNDTVAINYDKYNTFVNNYLAQYGLSSSAADVSLVLYLDEPTESRQVASIAIPLGKQTFGITKSAVSNKNKTVEIVNDVWNEYNSICAFLATILVIISLVILFKTTKLVLKVTNNKNKYQARLHEILRVYDRIIVIARDGYESNKKRNVIKVASFEELLAAHETLNKPIIFSKVNDIKCEFIVEDNKTLYKYVLKEADL